MASRGMHVNYLRRESEGELTLNGVKLAQIRELSAEEIALLEK